jgi:hypothetical protein
MIHAYIAANGQEEVTYESELLAAAKKRLNGEVDWQGLLDVCMFSEDRDMGDDNDAHSKFIHRTSTTKLLSTMQIIGLDRGVLHWEMQRRLVHDAITLVNSFKHCLYVVIMVINFFLERHCPGLRIAFPAFCTVKKDY